MHSREPSSRDSETGAAPQAKFGPLPISSVSVDPVEQLLEEMQEEPEPQSLAYGTGLRGRVAVVTGGATGIGKAIALEFARHGCHVAFNWYSYDESGDIAEEADRTAREITHLEVQCHSQECDVRDPGEVESFVRRTQEELGAINILVNNAGIARDRALWRLTDEQWRTVLDTNLTGAFNMIRAVAALFRRQHDGKIVNVSSVHGIRSEFGLANYSASKAGLLGLTRSAALELGPANVNVNAVAPGYIRTTRLTSGVPAEILDTARERSVLGRLGDPQDVANVVVFLCSEYARHITGTVIPVDGGHLL
ncbi:MAG TPA: 3-oxoacyl-ACP reductase FabG [Longimicrobiaceae bacterium]|jgi:3-oxoacyl-[acyl-carrier protein] reductase|nr:3-oxoacyl-ACP reductase FabG [Longimicrobiaceae bacterium]